jgi:hypothetical protein
MMMSAKRDSDRPRLGVRHVTVVPTNFDPEDGSATSDRADPT